MRRRGRTTLEMTRGGRPRRTPDPQVPKCHHCKRRPSAKGSFFCTVKHAREYAEELLQKKRMRWCPTCDAWTRPGCKGLHPSYDDNDGEELYR